MVRRALRVAPFVLAVTAVAMLVWAFISAVQAHNDLVRARDRLTALRQGTSVDPEVLSAAIAQAQGDVRKAQGRLDDVGPAVVGHLPLLGRSVVAERTTATAAEHVLDVGNDLLDILREPKPVFSGKRVDLARLADISTRLAAAGDALQADRARLGRLDTGLTPPIVGSGVADARELVRTAYDGFVHAAGLADTVAGICGKAGPRRLLIVLENNAELRGAGGLISVFAEATINAGRISIGPFRDVEDFAARPNTAKRVDAPADYVKAYGQFLANTTLWRNVNMSPDLPTSSLVLSNVAAVSLGHQPDAVLSIDVGAVAQLLAVVGPAQLPDGTQVTTKNAVDKLLVDAYRGVPDTEDGHAERRRRLRVTADAVVARILGGGAAGTVPLARALAHAAAGRHIALWSARAGEQSALEDAAAAGHVRAGDPDMSMVTVQNLGGGRGEGNKLDIYARRTLKVVTRLSRTSAETTQTFTLKNNSPTSGLTRYVAGLENPGQTRNLVAFAVPPGAQDVSFQRGSEHLAAQTRDEGGYRVLGDIVALDAGDEMTWTLSYRLPLAGHHYGLRVIPQPLAHDATLTVDIASVKGTVLHRVRGGSLQGDSDLDVERHWTMELGGNSVWASIRRFWNEPLF